MRSKEKNMDLEVKVQILTLLFPHEDRKVLTLTLHSK